MTNASQNEPLIREFVDQAITHATASHSSDSNEAARRLATIYRELRGPGKAARLELLQLITHENDAVRLWAATYCLEFSPQVAETALIALSGGQPGPIRASASMTLREWRNGRLTFP